ncbi:MAG: hypothetical protein EBT98_00835 [Opitutaceae bacterium]|jgi:hypothetical protein|nr:hypothetical protein [Opitutaceae bacterium]
MIMKNIVSAESGAAAPSRPLSPPSDRSLWLWVSTGFLLLGLLWAILFMVAHSVQVKSVPIIKKGGRT